MKIKINRKIFYLFRATFRLFLSFGRAEWYARRPLLRSLDLPHGLTISTKEKRRLKHYFYGTTYLAAVMCCLRNQARSPGERYLFSNLSALACSFDDLVDAFRQDSDPDFFWQDNPEAYGLAADKRGLALHLLHNIYRALPANDLGRFRAYMHRVFNLETAGRQKAGIKGCLDMGELEKITAEKGGCSVLLFRSVLSHPLSEAEENALYQFGYLIQCSDDIFDLWQDRQAGIVTLTTLLTDQGDLSLLTKMFEQQVVATQQAFRQTGYPSIQVETALHMIRYLVSITRVCLQRYQDLEIKYGKLPFNDRTAMVVDMEINSNRFRAFHYLLRPL